MSELSQTSGVAVATIKFYLREGLLPPGRATAATQAQYDDSHVARLRLIRALVDVGGLSLASVRSVILALDTEGGGLRAAVGTAHDALPPAVADRGPAPERALAMTAALDWNVDPQSSALYQLEAALAAVEAVGLPAGPDRLRTYADAALQVARVDVAGLPGGSAADVVQQVVLGTVLYEPILLALRRLAQQHAFTEARNPPAAGRVLPL